MKKLLDWAERYPVYSLEEPYEGATDRDPLLVDVDEALWERYRVAQIEFDAVQGLLAGLRK